MLTLRGVAFVVVGFAVRLNPLLVVMIAAFITGLAAGLSPLEVLDAFGRAFNDNRFVSAYYGLISNSWVCRNKNAPQA